MITKFTLAHERLIARLPVHTHHRRLTVTQSPPKCSPYCRGAMSIVVKGVTYPSISMARAKLGIGMKRLYQMLDSGEAKYA